jgi:hypothetical protein
MQSYHHFGGASLLGKLIRQVVNDAAAHAEVLVPDPEKTPIPGSPPFWHSYTTASRFQRQAIRDPYAPEMVWRVDEFLGLDRQPSDDENAPAVHLLKRDGGDANLVVCLGL